MAFFLHMASGLITPQVAATLFFATVIASAFGFGEALIAMPLLAMIMPVGQAAPLTVLVSITLALVVTVQDRQRVDVRSALRLFLYSVLGVPFGLLLLVKVPEQAVKLVLALVIIAFSAYSLAARRPAVAEVPAKAEGLFGFVSGVLGGAYGMNGPPLVMYGALRGWSPQKFRATLQGYFLPAGILSALGYWVTGLWSPVVTHYFLWSLPGVLAAIFLGRAVNERMKGPAFMRYIHIGLIIAALMLAAM